MLRQWIRSLTGCSSPAPGRRASSRRLGLERLEAREVPAISVLALPGSPTLTITADTSSFNNVTVTRENNLILGPVLAVRNSGNGQVAFVRSGPITGIVFNGSANGDVFRNATNVPSTIFGNGGNDTLFGGAGSDTISGGPGNDAIDGGDTSVNTLVESGGSFTLADPAPGSPSATLSGTGTGNDLLLRIQNVRLSGSVGNDSFNVSGYSGRVELDGGGGVGNDLFRLGPGPAVVDGGGNGPPGDVVIAEGLGSARFDGFNLLTNRATYTLRDVEAITLSGTAGNDMFDLAGLTQALTVNGLGGDDVIRGGSGTNSINAGPGTNVILTGAGTDVVTPGNNLVDGLRNRPLAPADLSATAGSLRVALVGDALNVFGPTGAGFTLRGAWRREAVGRAERFDVSGDVTLETGLGDLPFVVPDLEPLSFLTTDDEVAGFGAVAAMSWTSPPELTTLTSSGPLALFRSRYGLDLTATGASWRLALGRDIPGGGTMPLNPAVPYLYFTADSAFLASFAGRSAPAGGASLTVVFDPSDPSLFVRSSVPDALEVGVSAKGLIPFRATHSRITSFFGNLATPASLTFGSVIAANNFGVPISGLEVATSGLAVFDFDTNDDGIPVIMPSPARIRDLISSQATVDRVFLGTSDILVGLNGGARFTYGSAETAFPIVADHASLSYTAGVLLAAADSVVADALTPPALFSPGGMTLDVRFDPSARHFTAMLRGTLAPSLGDFLPGPAALSLTEDGITLDGQTVGVLGFGSIHVSGAVGLHPLTNTLVYDLTGPGSSGFVFIAPGSQNLPTGPIITGSGVINGTARVTNLLGNAQFTIDFTRSFTASNVFTSFAGEMKGTLSVTPAGGGVQVTGSGKTSGTLTPLIGAPFAASDDWVLENNNQFFADLPGQTVLTRFNAAPAFRDRAITPRARVGEVVTLSGRITEADPADKFLLEVNWGDGTVETFTFPPGSDGRLVEVAHRYRKASPPGQPYRVTAAWRDPQGAGNSAEFTVEILARAVQRASSRALQAADLLGDARETWVDLDGDGVAEALALGRIGDRPWLFVVSGRTGGVLAGLVRRDRPQTVIWPGADGGVMTLVVRWQREQTGDLITFDDPATGEQLLRVHFS